jgi:hypothetical protein
MLWDKEVVVIKSCSQPIHTNPANGGFFGVERQWLNKPTTFKRILRRGNHFIAIKSSRLIPSPFNYGQEE